MEVHQASGRRSHLQAILTLTSVALLSGSRSLCASRARCLRYGVDMS